MLYKRGEIYYTRFTAKGIRVNKSCGTKKRTEAAAYEQKLRDNIWNRQHLGVEAGRTWQEAVNSWLDTKAHKRSLDDDLIRLMWLETHLNDVHVTDITAKRVENVMDNKQVSNATRNRYYSVIRGVLKRAHKLGWITSVPVIENLEEPPITPKFLTKEQAADLLKELDTQRRKHLHDMAKLSLLTGLRESNVTGLTWSRVNLDNGYLFVEAETAKGKRTIRVPLNQAAQDVLRSWEGKHDTYVFIYRGQPIRKANRDGFKAAKKKAGLDWMRWHDLRHTWASWHVMAGTPLRVLQELGGWANLDMVLRYAHLAPDYADSYAENVAQNLTQLPQEETERDVTA